MQKNVITIEIKKTAFDASVILRDKEISFLVIIHEGKPVRIVSERDIARKIGVEDLAASSISLEDIVSKKIRWVNPDTMIEDAVQKMINNNIRHLIVLENENLVWIITQTNLAELLRSKILINGTVENIES